MLTSSLDSEFLVRRRVCGLWASLWSGAVWWVVDRTTWSHRTAVGTAAGGWGSLGGLLSEHPGVFGPLLAPRRVVRGRLVGCWG